MDFNSSISGTIHSNIISLKSIDSSSIIKAGSLEIFSSFFKDSSLVISVFMKSFNQSSSIAKFTF